MICNTHITCNPSPLCVDSLVIGTISALSTSVKVFFHNVATDVRFSLPASSNGAGLVTVDVSELNFSPDKTFIINIAHSTTFALYDITIGTSTSKEVQVRFIDYKDEDFDCAGVNSFTLSEVE